MIAKNMLMRHIFIYQPQIHSVMLMVRGKILPQPTEGDSQSEEIIIWNSVLLCLSHNVAAFHSTKRVYLE